MYRIIISPQAQKEIKKIKKTYQDAINNAVKELREDPSSGKALGSDLNGRFSYKVGPYRIIYLINKKDKIINILTAGHRSIVYK